MKLLNKPTFTNISWQHLCCRRQGKESSGSPFPGNLVPAAEPKARITSDLNPRPGAACRQRVWPRDPAMPLRPGLSPHTGTAARSVSSPSAPSNLGCCRGKVRRSSANAVSSGSVPHAGPRLKACPCSPPQADTNPRSQGTCPALLSQQGPAATPAARGGLQRRSPRLLTHPTRWGRPIAAPHAAARRGRGTQSPSTNSRFSTVRFRGCASRQAPRGRVLMGTPLSLSDIFGISCVWERDAF